MLSPLPSSAFISQREEKQTLKRPGDERGGEEFPDKHQHDEAHFGSRASSGSTAASQESCRSPPPSPSTTSYEEFSNDFAGESDSEDGVSSSSDHSEVSATGIAEQPILSTSEISEFLKLWPGMLGVDDS